MIRKVLLVLLVPVVITACGKQETPAPAVPAATPAAVAPEALPPPAELGDSCSRDCGNGVTASIQCAEGETPVCDCAAPQNAVCNPPSPAAGT